MNVLILGAGGHAQVVAEAMWRAHEAGSPLRPIGYLDDDAALHGQERLGLPVWGSLVMVTTVAHDAVVLAIGDNRTRQEIFARLLQRGEYFATIIHPHAIVSADVAVGAGTVVLAGAIVNTGSVIGANVILNTGCTVDHHNQIGDHAHIGPGAHLGGDVLVGAGALIGIGAVVMPQRQVGPWAIVGAGAVVARDVGDHSIVVGVPARPTDRKRA